MENIYKQIAKKHGTTAEEVKNEIQKVIKKAYLSNGHKRRVPTNEEFIMLAVKKIKKELLD